jgi:hypothetical protein
VPSWLSSAAISFFSEVTAMDNEGLRIGLMVGGLLMAIIPIIFGVGAIIFLFKKYREEP